MNSMVHCQLWMGSLEPYMTETFILTAFRKMGENPLSVKIMRNKLSGDAAGYCFVHFATDEEAIDAMHKLNGKIIPNTTPVIRFRLNNASNTGRSFVEREFSVWVGDLSPDVDDYNLYRVFSSKYNTIKTAKVILDNSGFSKGYGFVRFGSEQEMRDSLISMNGYIGLGSKALKISNAVPKPKGALTPGTPNNQSNSTDFSQYQQDPSAYWQNYASWQSQGYYEQPGHPPVPPHQDPAQLFLEKKDDLDLIEHTFPLDIDKMNRDKIGADCNLWDAIESSKWLPYDMFEVV